MPVRSGRCSPFARMSDIRLRYWYSSWEGFVGVDVEVPFVVEGVSFGVCEGSEGDMTGSRVGEAIVYVVCAVDVV